MAVSSSKCNRVKFLGPVSFKVKGAGGEEEFGRAVPIQRLTRTCIEVPSDVIELFLREGREVCTFGQELTQETIDVFIDATLPRTVRVGEIDLYAGCFRKFCML